MTIPELLKEAYNRRDWAIIEEAYSMLTGAQLSNGNYDYEDREESNLPSYSPPQEQTAYQMPTSPNGDKKPCRTESIDVRKNKINIYQDDGTEATEDSKIDRILTNRPIVPRSRGSDMANVTCRNCGRRYSVSQALASSKFLCDGCIGGRR